MITYIAHKIRGDIPRNTATVRLILRQLSREVPVITPIAPYLSTLTYLDDSDDDQRYIGMLINKAHFTSGFVKQMYVYGERSPGVEMEINWACEHGIPIYFFDVPEGVQQEIQRKFFTEPSKL